LGQREGVSMFFDLTQEELEELMGKLEKDQKPAVSESIEPELPLTQQELWEKRYDEERGKKWVRNRPNP